MYLQNETIDGKVFELLPHKMPRTRKPRAGSMQFWPRVRSKLSYPRIRNWASSNEIKPLGFAGYKVGMTHLLINDNHPHSLTRGTDIFCPVTIIECPPLKVLSIKFYQKTISGLKLISEIIADSLYKEIDRKITIPKKKGREASDFDFVTLLCCTQPSLTNIGKKKPEMFEMVIGGDKQQQLKFAKDKLGKELNIFEVFKEGQYLDIHSVTIGKGFQGPMRRFGIQLRHHKSEKSRRNPGSLGAWRAQGHIMWRVAHAGKLGYHLRTEYNKLLIKIGTKTEEINERGGILHYGIVKNPYILIKGSIGGAQKRLVRFTDPMRPHKDTLVQPQVVYVSLESKQGR